ncbi:MULTISPECIES: SAM-dependent methyltransferase [unclassified Streptomyces]|uniref:SAM-dependent methyltransferase n=1 Tax=unclassified Streptomyces TaxID=2593676 RepID=UPI0004CC430B|nr:SAM-dependent methyltransferase [Streptomyces sp. NRRL F-5135]
MTDLDRSSVVEIDTTRPHPARMYDYYLQGKDYYEVDEVAAANVEKVHPTVKITARTNRYFMHRATRYLAREAGIRQFLDIGTGIPTRPNLHQIAQEIAPDSRVVYADYDPVVLRHAEALMRSTPEGRTTYIQADVRDPKSIIESERLRDTLDLSRPVALSLNALLHFVPDEDGPHEIVRFLLDALPSGSYLVLSHCTPDFEPETWANVVAVYRQGGIPAQVRSRDEVLRFFDGLELVEPGVAVAHRWRPDGTALPEGVNDASVSIYAGVARKP